MTATYKINIANQFAALDSDESGDEGAGVIAPRIVPEAETEKPTAFKSDKSEFFRRGRQQPSAAKQEDSLDQRSGHGQGRGGLRGGRGRGQGGRGGGRGGVGRGGPRPPRSNTVQDDSVGTPTDMGESWGGPVGVFEEAGGDAGALESFDNGSGENDSPLKGRSDRGRGGRGGRGGEGGGRGRENFDRRSGTGRGREIKKGGGAGHNWGGKFSNSELQEPNSPVEAQEGQEPSAEAVHPDNEEVPRQPPRNNDQITLDQLRANQEEQRRLLPTRAADREESKPLTKEELEREGFCVKDLNAGSKDNRREAGEDAGGRSARGGMTMDLYTYADKYGYDFNIFKNKRGRGGRKGNEVPVPRPGQQVEPCIELEDESQFPSLF